MGNPLGVYEIMYKLKNGEKVLLREIWLASQNVTTRVSLLYFPCDLDIGHANTGSLKLDLINKDPFLATNCKYRESFLEKYQPSGAGGTRSPPATPHRPQNPKWPPGGPKMADVVWKGV